MQKQNIHEVKVLGIIKRPIEAKVDKKKLYYGNALSFM